MTYSTLQKQHIFKNGILVLDVCFMTSALLSHYIFNHYFFIKKIYVTEGKKPKEGCQGLHAKTEASVAICRRTVAEKKDNVLIKLQKETIYTLLKSNGS